MSSRVEMVKARIDALHFYESELESVSGRGVWRRARCPFHSPDRHPSFAFSTETGAFKCFACGARGSDVIHFTMKRHNLSFRYALDLLARNYGETL